MRHKHSETEPLALLIQGSAALGLKLPPTTLEHLHIYLEELKLWNARINLTSLKTDPDIIIKHFLDSLAVLPLVGAAASLVDLGSGAGFPGLVLKLAQPDLVLTLVEARQKKADFLEYLVSHLRLTDVKVVQTHLTPVLAQRWEPKVAAVVSRAAFSLPRFLELAAPLVETGGLVLALKGVNLADSEWGLAEAIRVRLNLGPLERQHYYLPISGEPRLLIRARKS
jgi:16S rRNA (guanine527-N7)-methyltransferase